MLRRWILLALLVAAWGTLAVPPAGGDEDLDRALADLVNRLARLDRATRALGERVEQLEAQRPPEEAAADEAPVETPDRAAGGSAKDEASSDHVVVDGHRFPRRRKFRHAYEFEETRLFKLPMLMSSRMYVPKEGAQKMRWDYAWVRVAHERDRSPPDAVVLEVTFKNRWRSSVSTFEGPLAVIADQRRVATFSKLQPFNWREDVFGYTTFHMWLSLDRYLALPRARRVVLDFGDGLVELRLRRSHLEAMADHQSRMVPAAK